MKNPNVKKLTQRGLAEHVDLKRRIRSAFWPLSIPEDTQEDIASIAQDVIFATTEGDLWEHPEMEEEVSK